MDKLHEEHSGIITLGLGVDRNIPIDLQYISGEAGDLYLLCSDGLTGSLRGDEISAVLARRRASLIECGKLLVEKAYRLECQDNASVLLVQRLS